MRLTKDWYKSKTIVALIGLAVLLGKDALGIEISESEILTIFEEVTKVVLLVLATYGRVTATKEIK